MGSAFDEQPSKRKAESVVGGHTLGGRKPLIDGPAPSPPGVRFAKQLSAFPRLLPTLARRPLDVRDIFQHFQHRRPGRIVPQRTKRNLALLTTRTALSSISLREQRRDGGAPGTDLPGGKGLPDWGGRTSRKLFRTSCRGPAERGLRSGPERPRSGIDDQFGPGVLALVLTAAPRRGLGQRI